MVFIISPSKAPSTGSRDTNMRQNNDPVPRQTQISLDTVRTDVDGPAEGRHGVLREGGLVAAVGDDLGEGGSVFWGLGMMGFGVGVEFESRCTRRVGVPTAAASAAFSGRRGRRHCRLIGEALFLDTLLLLLSALN